MTRCSKNLDSHLKPYLCKDEGCRDLKFSSNACLFRHEREAHSMHGHGENLCKFRNCERAQPGNGFPRRWNLGDHMKRVHGHDASMDEIPDDSHKSVHSTRRRKGASQVEMTQTKSQDSSRVKPRPTLLSRERQQPSENSQFYLDGMATDPMDCFEPMGNQMSDLEYPLMSAFAQPECQFQAGNSSYFSYVRPY